VAGIGQTVGRAVGDRDPLREERLEIAPGIEATIVGIAHERRAALH
jgi:hypothetical protein